MCINKLKASSKLCIIIISTSQEEAHLKNRIASFIIAALVSVFIIINFTNLHKNEISFNEERERLHAQQELTVFSERIETTLTSSIQYVGFYELLIARNKSYSESEFQYFSKSVLENATMIDSIALAPDSIVSSVYPLEGNEAVIGHNLMEDSKRRVFVEKAIEAKTLVLQGPVESIQGGRKIFSRKPIFIEEDGEEKYWGLSVITIDFDQLLEKSNLQSFLDGFKFALRAYKVDSYEDFIWGHGEIFSNNPIITVIQLPNQEWELAIYPEKGWASENSSFKSFPLFYYVIIFSAFLITYRFSWNYLQKSMEVKIDQLTGILNKKTFLTYTEKCLKNEKDLEHSLIFIDLDDFKEINDNYGHLVGDLVLIEVANRLKNVLRDRDSLSRFGGDEFQVFISNTFDKSNVQLVINRITEAFLEPITVQDLTIQINLSTGVASYPSDGKTYRELYQAADRKMYKSKREKKNS